MSQGEGHCDDAVGTMVYRIRKRAVEVGRSGHDTASILKVEFTDLDMEFSVKKNQDYDSKVLV